MWRVVCRPEWLRAPVRFFFVVRDSSGPPLCRCERSILTTKRVPGEVGFILMSAMADSPYFEAPPVKSMDCPVSRRTYAFLKPLRLPATFLKRRVLPGLLSRLTPSTLTSNINSTANLTSALDASSRTRNTYWFAFSVASASLKNTCGWISTVINRSLFIRASETLLEQLQCADRGQHLVVLDEAQWIERGHRHHVHIGHVAGGQEQLLFVGFHQNQRTGEPELRQFADQQLSSRGADFQRLYGYQAILAHQFRHHGLHGGAIHLAIHLLRKITRPRGERPAAAHPDGAAYGAGPGLAGALLAPRLLAAAADFRARLLLLGAGAPGGHVGRDDLVHQRFVVGAAEGGVRQLNFAGGAYILELKLHGGYFLSDLDAPLPAPPFAATGALFGAKRLRRACATAFKAGRTMTRPPSEPGTAPLINSRLRLTSTSTMRRFSMVRFLTPMWPDMRLPLNTRPGV